MRWWASGWRWHSRASGLPSEGAPGVQPCPPHISNAHVDPGEGDVASLCARSRCEPGCACVLNSFFTRCRWKRVAGLRRLRAEVVARPPASSGDSPHACTGKPETGKKEAKSGKRLLHSHNMFCLRTSARAPKRSAASRAGMAGWAGEGGGRFGERREYEAPTLPSTHRQHGSARHYISQARNSTSRQHGMAWHGMACHHTCQPSKYRLKTLASSKREGDHHNRTQQPRPLRAPVNQAFSADSYRV